jgi:hypothetical protein
MDISYNFLYISIIFTMWIFIMVNHISPYPYTSPGADSPSGGRLGVGRSWSLALAHGNSLKCWGSDFGVTLW